MTPGDLSVRLTDGFQARSLGYEHCPAHSWGESLGAGSVCRRLCCSLQQLGLRLSRASAAHPTAGETEIIWDLTDPQEENNRWRVKGAQR